jgi:DNA-binding TFAR19-related protein (PDSD5 family)
LQSSFEFYANLRVKTFLITVSLFLYSFIAFAEDLLGPEDFEKSFDWNKRSAEVLKESLKNLSNPSEQESINERKLQENWNKIKSDEMSQNIPDADLNKNQFRNSLSVLKGNLFPPELKRLEKLERVNPDTRKSLEKGLFWLHANQKEDGSWSDNLELTSLAILTFFAVCETDKSHRHGKVIERAITYLLQKRTEPFFEFFNNGKFYRVVEGDPLLYLHAIRTLALSEFYFLTKRKEFKDLVKESINCLIKSQKPNGGWTSSRYPNYVDAWVVRALRASSYTGIMHEEINIALTLHEKAPYADYHIANDYAKRSMVISSMQICKLGATKTVDRYFELIWHKKDSILKNKEPSFWFYFASNMSQISSESFYQQRYLKSFWQRKFVPHIIDYQLQDGSWPNLKQEGKEYDLKERSYSTSYAILSLLEDVRYPPTQPKPREKTFLQKLFGGSR